MSYGVALCKTRVISLSTKWFNFLTSTSEIVITVTIIVTFTTYEYRATTSARWDRAMVEPERRSTTIYDRGLHAVLIHGARNLFIFVHILVRFQRQYLIVSIKPHKFPIIKRYIVVLYREEHSKNHRPQHHNNHGQLQERKLPFKFFFLSYHLLSSWRMRQQQKRTHSGKFHFTDQTAQ